MRISIGPSVEGDSFYGRERELQRLVDECYLVKEAQDYRFISPMVRDWWQNSYDWER